MPKGLQSFVLCLCLLGLTGRALCADSDVPVPSRVSGSSYLREDFASAKNELAAFLADHPQNLIAWTDWINCLYVLGELDAYLEKPSSSTPWQDYATAYAHDLAGRRTMALDLLKQAVASGAEGAVSLNLLGVLRLAHGDIQGALAAFQKAALQDPSYAPGVENLAKIRKILEDPAPYLDARRKAAMTKDRREQVIQISLHMVTLQPKDPSQRWLLASLEIADGQWSKGLMDYLFGIGLSITYYWGLLAALGVGGVFLIITRKKQTDPHAARTLLAVFGCMILFRLSFFLITASHLLYFRDLGEVLPHAVFYLGNFFIMGFWAWKHIAKTHPAPQQYLFGNFSKRMAAEILIGFVVVACLVMLQDAARIVFNKPELTQGNPIVSQTVHAPSMLAQMTLAMFGMLVAPFCEELFFRGVLFETFKDRGILPAVIAVSLMFALYHQALSMGVLAFYSSLVLCMLLLRQKSLLPCFLLHAAINAVPYTLIWLAN